MAVLRPWPVNVENDGAMKCHSYLTLICTLCVLPFLAGPGPSDYEIRVYGDYYILVFGGSPALAREYPPTGSGMFKPLYEGVSGYGTDGVVIYGTSFNNEFFIVVPTDKVVTFRSKDEWVKALADHRVSDIKLMRPTPPTDAGTGMSTWSIVAISLLGLGGCLAVWLRLRRRKKRPMQVTNRGTC